MLTTLKLDWNAAELKIGLFTNNVSPTKTSTLATFTEATFSGYTRLVLNAFEGPTNIGANVWQLSHANVIWQSTAPTPAENVWGYVVADSSWTTLMWAEKFGSAIPVSVTGAVVLIGPRITGQSLFG